MTNFEKVESVMRTWRAVTIGNLYVDLTEAHCILWAHTDLDEREEEQKVYELLIETDIKKALDYAVNVMDNKFN